MTAPPHLVGISGRAGSGKTTASAELVDAGWVRIKMADPLKDMLRAIGLTESQIEGDLKELPCFLLQGKTPRHAMITLGTEWGRDMIGPNLWLTIARKRIRDAMGAGFNVVVDDVRYDNEAELIRELGGVVVGIKRDTSKGIDHKSEAGVAVDMEYVNAGSVNAMRMWFRYVFAMSGDK